MAAASDGTCVRPTTSSDKNNPPITEQNTEQTQSSQPKHYKSCIGLIFCILLFTSSFLGTIFMLAPLLLLLFVKPTWYRLLSDEVLSSWIIFVVALLEEVIGIKVVTTGDIIAMDEPCLIIMNHRTRLDWLFFFLCLMKRGSVLREKIILKSDLKGIPGAGWAMQQACFIFIHRKWQTDQIILTEILDYFRDSQYKPQILLFPEGTDFNPKAKAKSDEYAKEHELTQYEQVLHPRTTGFTFVAQYLRQSNLLSSVYDVTVAYPKSVSQNELDVLKGHFPEEIHFSVARHAASSVPSGERDLAAWCQQVWRDKERRLHTFYGPDGGRFPSPPTGRSLTWPLRVMVVFWGVLHVLWMAMLVWSAPVRWYCLGCILLYNLAYYRYGGLERVAMMCYRWREGSRGSQQPTHDD